MADEKRKPKYGFEREDEITLTLRALEDRWRENPELRLGQIVVNAATAIKGSDPTRTDVFNLPDSKLLRHLEQS